MIEAFLVSSQEKVFLDTRPKRLTEALTGLVGESVFFQVALSDAGSQHGAYVNVRIRADLAVTARTVENVPVVLSTFPDADEDYLRKAPGLYPDLLRALPAPGAIGQVRVLPGYWRALYIEARADEMTQAGAHAIEIEIVSPDNGALLARLSATVDILPARLRPQTLIRTNWLHADCLATYYRVPVFSEEHWRIWKNFIATAVRRGINTVLTPLFTPPLDTAIGSERPTVQLVDVTVTEDGYRFGFERLERFVEMCQSCGAEYFEMSHLFTQWGAKHAPKIMAWTSGAYKRIFGWETDAAGAEYAAFLAAFLPALDDELRALDIAGKTFLHLSDEPKAEQMDAYLAGKRLLTKYMPGYPILDALSDIRFWESGAVDRPACAINHIEPFLQAGVSPLWGYYCVGQYKDVSNLFIAMPPRRTRILGALLYKYRLQGFLQWGYNFYNTQLSVRAVDPYATTDADGAFPAGDPFQVYPGADGYPEESVRLILVYQAMQDLRALEMAQDLIGRENVQKMIDETLGAVTFSRCTRDDTSLERLRMRVNQLLARGVQASESSQS